MSENDYRGRWVRALRGDDFTQGREYLASTVEGVTKHCCLGVAAELFHEEMEIPRKSTHTGIIWFGGRSAYLPSLLAVALNLTQDHQTRLTMMNDSGVSFDSIAAWIEENVPEEDSSEDEKIYDVEEYEEKYSDD